MRRMPSLPWGIGLCAVALWAGCAKHESEVEVATRNHALLIGNSAEPQELDPQLVSASSDQVISAALFEGLCSIDERTSQAVPGVAEHWDSSPDGLRWTFHLRHNAKWSNGDPVTAGDFVRSWQRCVLPSLAAESAYYLFPIRNAEAINRGELKDPSALGVAAPDDFTLEITLAHPAPYLPGLAAQSSWYPVHLPTLEKAGAATTRNPGWTEPGKLVGNGPFVLSEWSPNARIVVKKNPAYWDAAHVALEQIVFFPNEDPNVEERDYRAGQRHITSELPISKVDRYQKEDPAAFRIEPSLETFFLRFNVTHSPLDRADVRLALAKAIDRDALTRSVLRNTRQPAEHLTPPDCAGYTTKARLTTDADEARRLLAAAGFPGGKGFPVLNVQTRNDELHTRVMEAVQAMWLKELGIKVALNSMEQKTWLQNQRTLNYDITTARWVGDFIDPVNYLEIFLGDGGYNWTGWKNAEYDRLVGEAYRTADTARRYAHFQAAEAILLKEAPIAPLFFGARTYLVRSSVHNWEPALLGIHQFKKVELR